MIQIETIYHKKKEIISYRINKMHSQKKDCIIYLNFKNYQNYLMQCPICCEQKLLMTLSSNCEHRFCQDCCFSHIKEKADRFTPIVCAYPNCDQKFDKESSLQLYQLLPAEVKDKIDAYVKYQFFSKNPNFKPCSVANCIGKINTKDKLWQCDICQVKHCHQCLKKFHQGACIADDHDRYMREAQNQKCPSCQIWVQKKEGCDYIDCKCGAKFCFKCGNPFNEDPCRKKQIWTYEANLRKLISKIKLQWPTQNMTKLEKLKILAIQFSKMVIKFPILISYIIILSLFLLAVIVFLIATGLILAPIISLAIICHQGDIPAICRIFMLVLWPFLTAFLAIIFVFMILLYPIMRTTYHHGIYDGCEKMMNCFVECFLKGIVNIFQWCQILQKIRQENIQKNNAPVSSVQ